jgi:hypothetical protein
MSHLVNKFKKVTLEEAVTRNATKDGKTGSDASPDSNISITDTAFADATDKGVDKRKQSSIGRP